MDALTDIIRLLRPQTVLLGRMAAAGRWGVRVPPQPGPAFYLVVEGRCWFRAARGEDIELQRGDYLLSARPTADTFVSAPGVDIALSDEAFKARHSVDGELWVGEKGEGPVTRILGGVVACEPANAELLVGLMPRLIHVKASEGSGARLRSLVAIIRDESTSELPGRDVVLTRLIEVMLVDALRAACEVASGDAGLLRGLLDPPVARALAGIHADVGRSWTVEALARQAGMSRAAFARRFAATIGAAPVEYLLRWRMALAKEALRGGRGSLEQIAAQVGYQSASAFSTAFSRQVGCPPSVYARGLADPADRSTLDARSS